MENAHIVSALVAKIARIQGEIDTHYEAIKGLETKASTLKQGLRIFDENFDLRRIKATRHRNALFKPRELKRLVIEALKQRQGVNLNELTALIARSKNLDIKVVKPKVQRTIRALIKNGVVSFLNNNAIFENTTIKSSSEPILSLNLGCLMKF